MKNPLKIALAATLVSWLLAAGCATRPGDAVGGIGPTDTCQVCRYNHDLACVCVKVTDSTPRAEYQGKTYHFCSDDCRASFLKKPDKYLPKH